MQVTETKTEGLRREFKVIVPASDIDQQLNARLVELGKRVSMPGFRPGKVPMDVVKKRYAASVMGEVLERAVMDSSNKAIAERELRPAATPKIEVTAFEEGKDLEFTLAFDLLPKFEPMDFRKIKLEKLKVSIDDAEVDEALAGIAKKHKRFAKIKDERPAKMGDLVVIDFEGKINDVAFDGGTAKGFELELGSGRFVPGFEDQLVGAKVGDPVTVRAAFPKAHQVKEVAGKNAVFGVVVREIREPAPVAVDDELAKDLGFDSMAEMRNVLKQQIERDYSSVSRARLKRELMDVLAQEHHFELPKGVVDAEFEAIWNQYKHEQAHAHGHEHGHDHEHDHDHEHVHEHVHKEGAEAESNEDAEARAECEMVAERRVRLGLLLGEVGNRNNITVTPEEVTKAMRAEAMRYPGQEKQVIEYFQRTPEAMAGLRAPIFEDKVIDFILEMADVSERTVTPEELMKEPEEAGEGDEGGKPSKEAKPKKKKAAKAK